MPTELKAAQYRFDAGMNGGHTDLYLPFDLLGIDNPAASPLILFGFATDENAMYLWTTMPPTNPVNSPDVVETMLYAGADQVFQLSHAYFFPNL